MAIQCCNKSESYTNSRVDECVEKGKKTSEFNYTLWTDFAHGLCMYLAWHGMAWVMLLCVLIFRMVQKISN